MSKNVKKMFKKYPVVDAAFWHTPWGAFGTFPEIWEMPWGAFVAPPETHRVVLGGVGGARFGSQGALGGAWERSPGGRGGAGAGFSPPGPRGPAALRLESGVLGAGPWVCGPGLGFLVLGLGVRELVLVSGGGVRRSGSQVRGSWCQMLRSVC